MCTPVSWRIVMEVRTQSKEGPQVLDVDKRVEKINEKLKAAKEEWLKRLRAQPQKFAEIEKGIHETFQRMADEVTASVLAEATRESPALESKKKR